MAVTLELAKAHLRVIHDDQDDLIAQHMATAAATMLRYTGDNYDAEEDDLIAAELLLIGWLFYPSEELRIDPNTGLPLAVSALAGPFRLPTIAGGSDD